eukprot:1792229-Amphidinium_carterae.2
MFSPSSLQKSNPVLVNERLSGQSAHTAFITPENSLLEFRWAGETLYCSDLCNMWKEAAQVSLKRCLSSQKGAPQLWGGSCWYVGVSCQQQRYAAARLSQFISDDDDDDDDDDGLTISMCCIGKRSLILLVTPKLSAYFITVSIAVAVFHSCRIGNAIWKN